MYFYKMQKLSNVIRQKIGSTTPIKENDLAFFISSQFINGKMAGQKMQRYAVFRSVLRIRDVYSGPGS